MSRTLLVAGGAPPFTGFGILLHVVSDSRGIGLDPDDVNIGGVRAPLGSDLPDLVFVGSQGPDAWGLHDGYSGAPVATIKAHADGAAYNATHALVWDGLNDTRTAPYYYSKITHDDYAEQFDNIYATQSPKTIVIVEPPFIGGYSTREEERQHGLSEWQRNILVYEQIALGRNVRLYDRPWLTSEIGLSGGTGQRLHPTLATYESIEVEIKRMLRSWPAAPAQAPYLRDLATLQAEFGSDLAMVHDMRSKPTETAGSLARGGVGGRVSQRNDLVGGFHLIGTTDAIQCAPRWMGGGDEFHRNTSGEDGLLSMYGTMAGTNVIAAGGACSVGIRFREYSVNQSWTAPNQPQTLLCAFRHGTDIAFYVMLSSPDAAHTELHVHARTGVTKHVSVKCAITSTTDLRNIIIDDAGGDADDPANYTVTLDGVTQTMSAGGFDFTSLARSDGAMGGLSQQYLVLYGAVRKWAVAAGTLTTSRRAVLTNWLNAELGVAA